VDLELGVEKGTYQGCPEGLGMVYSAPKFRDALQQLFQYHQEKTEELWRRRTIQTAIAPSAALNRHPQHFMRKRTHIRASTATTFMV
jgi:hypothetical protein